MNREFSVVIEKDEDGYFVASVPTLRGCHTQAKSLDVLMKRVKEAIQLCLEIEDPAATEFIGYSGDIIQLSNLLFPGFPCLRVRPVIFSSDSINDKSPAGRPVLVANRSASDCRSFASARNNRQLSSVVVV
ncbi:MAG: type II toxin-antitoxin system HicB family antitoxin [Syntrophales bacterium]